MARFKVTTPALGFTGLVGSVHFADGAAEVDDEVDDGRHAPALAYFRAQGYGVETLDGDGQADEPAGPPAVASGGEGPPPARADKAAWVDYAVRRGMDRAEAERTSKERLVERFGGQEGAQS
jgi:hypothetical protein